MQQPSPPFPFRHATAAYVLALVLLFLAGVTGYGVVSALHDQTAQDAAFVNAAGRQRMLAQRIVRLALTVKFARDESERELRGGELASAVEAWDRGHDAIVDGEATSRIALLLVSNALAPASTARLASSRRELARMTSGFLGTEVFPVSDDDFAALSDAGDAYVTDMDRFVLAIQRDNEKRSHNVSYALGFVLAFSTLLIVLEGALIFRPLVHRLRASHQRLFEAHESLREEVERRRALETERDLLRGLLPICAGCKKIRDGSGRWLAIEHYIEARSEARFSHGLCEECVRRLYPDIAGRILAKDS